MSITLYRKPDYEGDTYAVTHNMRALKETPVKNLASSVRLTAESDKVLLFKKEDWDGGVMFRAGRWSISKLSSPGSGGKIGFGDTISSVRLTPFNIKVFVNVIQNDNGRYPGGLASETEVETVLDQMFTAANNIWEQGLVKLVRRGIIFRRSTKFFNMNKEALALALKSGWRQSGHVNLFFINNMTGALGEQIPAGKLIVVTHNADGTDAMGNTLAHEFGHFVGLSHHTAQLERENLMQGPGKGSDWWVNRTELTGQQTEDTHEVLSKNIFKGTVRVD